MDKVRWKLALVVLALGLCMAIARPWIDPSDSDGRAVFRPGDFGARGDGRTDDTDAFSRMHAEIIRLQNEHPDVRIRIELGTPGQGRHYVYRWNRWTWGIRDLVLEGNGSTIQNLSDSAWNIDQTALRTNRDAFHTQGYHDSEEANAWENYDRFGHDIATAPAGASFVELVDPKDATAFEVGKLALVASFDQQGGGYPPNPRYYDWVRVTGIDGGRITFDGQPLKYEHRSDLPYRRDFKEPALPARELIDNAVIVPAEREVPWTERLVIRNLTTAPNPNVTGIAMEAVGTLQIDSASTVVLDNVTTNWLVIAMTQHVLIRHSHVIGELDKINGTIRFEDSTLSFSEATGVERIEVVNSTVMGQIRTLARESHFEGVTFDFSDEDKISPGALYIEGFTPVYLLEVANSRFIGSPNEDEPAFVTYEPTIEFAINDKDLVLRDGSLEVPPGSGMWDVGMNVIYEGLEIELDSAAGMAKGCGRVRSVRSGGSIQTAVIGVDWLGSAPIAGDRVKIFELTEIRGTDNRLKDAKLHTALYGVGRMEWNGEVILPGPCEAFGTKPG